MKTKKFSASVEDYLEAIYNIIAEKQAVRGKDISKRLGVSNASVTGSLHHLAEMKLINYTPYDVITLTSAGQKSALDVIKRHEVMTDFFVKVLGIKQSEAEEEACKVEHSISQNVLDRMIKFLDYSLVGNSRMLKCVENFKKSVG